MDWYEAFWPPVELPMFLTAQCTDAHSSANSSSSVWALSRKQDSQSPSYSNLFCFCFFLFDYSLVSSAAFLLLPSIIGFSFLAGVSIFLGLAFSLSLLMDKQSWYALLWVLFNEREWEGGREQKWEVLPQHLYCFTKKAVMVKTLISSRMYGYKERLKDRFRDSILYCCVSQTIQS